MSVSRRLLRPLLCLAALGAAALGLPAAVPAGATAPVPPPADTLFSYSGGEQTYVVPVGVTSIPFIAVGGHGGQGWSGIPGGAGARVTGTLPVTPGETLYIEVGGNGADVSFHATGGDGGFNDGGRGGDACGDCGSAGAGGGGAADVRTVARGDVGSLGSRLFVAAGGGGGGGNDRAGGSAGGAAGQSGTAASSGADGGGAGTALAGGSGGAGAFGASAGADGGAGSGGAGASSLDGGGGGGSGYFGGGGGGGNADFDHFGGGGGGGGSSIAGSATGVSITTDTSGTPLICFDYSGLCDTTAPTSAISFPVAATYYGAPHWNGSSCPSAGFCGTAQDNPGGAGVEEVDWSLQQAGGNYWGGHGFTSAGEAFFPASGTSSWSQAFPFSNFPAEGSYTLHVRAIDNAGQVETDPSVTFIVDTTAPTSTIYFPTASSYTAGTWCVGGFSCPGPGAAFWGVASDSFPGSGWAGTQWSLRRGTGNYWGGNGFTNAGETFFDATVYNNFDCPFFLFGGGDCWGQAFPFSNFPAGGSYTLSVRAFDKAGNVETDPAVTFTINQAGGSACPPGGSVNVRWHYGANGSAGGWSGTKSTSCKDGSVTIGPQAMEGDLRIDPGTQLKTGYSFSLPGNKRGFTATVTSPTVVLQLHCVSGAAPSQSTLAVAMATQSYTGTGSSWIPSGSQSSPLVYQGATAMPNACGGGKVRLDKGGTFSATITLS